MLSVLMPLAAARWAVSQAVTADADNVNRAWWRPVLRWDRRALMWRGEAPPAAGHNTAWDRSKTQCGFTGWSEGGSVQTQTAVRAAWPARCVLGYVSAGRLDAAVQQELQDHGNLSFQACCCTAALHQWHDRTLPFTIHYKRVLLPLPGRTAD